MRKKIVSVAAALVLATSHLAAAPAVAQEPEQSSAAQQDTGSSDGQKAALIIGSIVAVLAAVGGGAVWAIQQGIIANPLPGIIPGPARPANRAPLYGEPCSWDMVLQPARGRDGRWLVCVASPEPTWVYGTQPRGIGTAREGAYCTEREKGGQDSRGRMMLCLNNQWVYGP